VRALLIVNPHATSTTRGRRDVIVRALASAVDLEVVETRYRGDATRLAATAASDKFDLVMTLGGDGTVNEAVNGLLGGAGNPGAGSARASAPGARSAGAFGPGVAAPRAAGSAAGLGAASASAAGGTGSGATRGTPVPGDHGILSDDPAAAGLVPPADADDLPALAALPGGNANVFTRSLGLPTDPVDAAARLIEDLIAGRERRIGLGIGNGRYFTFNAGLGLDAEVVRAVEGRRAHGRTLTPARYIRTALVQYYQVTDRRQPAISIAEPAGLCQDALYLCIVSNSAPWTYLGRRPVNASPNASFDTGLDLLGFRRLGTIGTLRILRQMFTERAEPPRGRSVVAGHDLSAIQLAATRPVAFQLDGEYMGEVEQVLFRSAPLALRVIG
jgi:diacylglycerol kinase family enzyme